ncbi:hypothetical protein F4802DRAFT_58118 [Xylaria palmicola]|nr:hypothetical protein F4802DRAFT_58118 [Xylaria palmicola]
MPADLPVLTVADAAAWAGWLVRSAAMSRGVWLTLAKKGNTSPTSLTYAQALDEALCQGWIDGQARGGDARAYAQRFTPRAPRSLWSRRNVEHVARLEREGRVTPLGRAAVDAARADGRWDAAYAGQSTAELPPEFLAAVAAVPAAQATWDAATRANRFAVYFRLNALKTQAGRERRIVAFVEMLARGETPYPQKQKPAVMAKDLPKETTPGGRTARKAAVRRAASEKAAGSEAVSAVRVRQVPTLRSDGEPVRRSSRLLQTAAPPP